MKKNKLLAGLMTVVLTCSMSMTALAAPKPFKFNADELKKITIQNNFIVGTTTGGTITFEKGLLKKGDKITGDFAETTVNDVTTDTVINIDKSKLTDKKGSIKIKVLPITSTEATVSGDIVIKFNAKKTAKITDIVTTSDIVIDNKSDVPDVLTIKSAGIKANDILCIYTI